MSLSRCPFCSLNFLKIWTDSPKQQPLSFSKHGLIAFPKNLTQPLFSQLSCPHFLSIVQLHLSSTLPWCGCTFLTTSNGVDAPFLHPPMVRLHLSSTLQWCGCTFLTLSNGATTPFFHPLQWCSCTFLPPSSMVRLHLSSFSGAPILLPIVIPPSRMLYIHPKHSLYLTYAQHFSFLTC